MPLALNKIKPASCGLSISQQEGGLKGPILCMGILLGSSLQCIAVPFPFFFPQGVLSSKNLPLSPLKFGIREWKDNLRPILPLGADAWLWVCLNSIPCKTNYGHPVLAQHHWEAKCLAIAVILVSQPYTDNLGHKSGSYIPMNVAYTQPLSSLQSFGVISCSWINVCPEPDSSRPNISVLFTMARTT